jgi:hypothetical protein
MCQCANAQKLLIACMACDWQAVSELLLVKLAGLSNYCYAIQKFTASS